MKNFGLIFFLLAFVAGCSTTSRELKVYSFPEQAEVWVRPVSHEKPELVGVTPLVVTSEDLIKRSDGREALVFELRKDGFKNEEFLVTDIEQVDLSVTKRMTTTIGWKDAALLNKAIETLFEVRSLTDAKKYEHALTLLNELKGEYPNLSAIYELEGGIFILKQQYISALDSYTKASDFNPSNGSLKETVRQLESLVNLPPRTKLGDLPRLPTTEKGKGSQ